MSTTALIRSLFTEFVSKWRIDISSAISEYFEKLELHHLIWLSLCSLALSAHNRKDMNLYFSNLEISGTMQHCVKSAMTFEVF